MTKNSDEKRAVRELAEAEGLKYTEALRKHRAEEGDATQRRRGQEAERIIREAFDGKRGGGGADVGAREIEAVQSLVKQLGIDGRRACDIYETERRGGILPMRDWLISRPERAAGQLSTLRWTLGSTWLYDASTRGDLPENPTSSLAPLEDWIFEQPRGQEEMLEELRDIFAPAYFAYAAGRLPTVDARTRAQRAGLDQKVAVRHEWIDPAGGPGLDDVYATIEGSSGIGGNEMSLFPTRDLAIANARTARMSGWVSSVAVLRGHITKKPVDGGQPTVLISAMIDVDWHREFADAARRLADDQEARIR